MAGTLSSSFRIEGPALVSFSGGRTSGYMLWRILQAHGGTLPDDVKVCFANTGKEMPETLDFVRDCGERWGVHVRWLEWAENDAVPQRFREVDYTTASRNGEPFEAMVKRRKMLPNPIARICTVELKILTQERWAKSVLQWDEWTNCVGLRADEMHRVVKLKNKNRCAEPIAPLATAGITKADVHAFWSRQNFNLGLPDINGVTPAGNCDLCFLKGAVTISGLIRDNPSLADWWVKMEAEAVARQTMRKPEMALFRKDRPSYAGMLDAVKRQQNFDFGDLDERQECFCHE